MNNNEKAKELFYMFDCSHMFLSMEGRDEEYNSYNIDKNTEILWIREFINNNIDYIDICPLEAIYKLYNCGIYEYIDLTKLMCLKIRTKYLNINDVKIITICMVIKDMIECADINYVKKYLKNTIKILLLKINRNNIDTSSISDSSFTPRSEINKCYLDKYNMLIDYVNK